MILYIENPKDATGEILELINELGKAAESDKTEATKQQQQQDINTQKSVVFLYTNKIRRKLRKRSHLPSHYKNKITRNKPM